MPRKDLEQRRAYYKIRDKKRRLLYPEKIKERARKYKKANPKRFEAYRKKREAGYQKLIRPFKLSPCEDCGVSYPPYVMDFDHVEGKKLMKISDMVYRNVALVLAEIAKCEVVCSNCHRERTHKRKQK